MMVDQLKHLAASVIEMGEKATAKNLATEAHVTEHDRLHIVDGEAWLGALPRDLALELLSFRTSAPKLAQAVMKLLVVAECAREVRDGLWTDDTDDLLARSGLDAALAALDEAEKDTRD